MSKTNIVIYILYAKHELVASDPRVLTSKKEEIPKKAQWMRSGIISFVFVASFAILLKCVDDIFILCLLK